LVSFLIVLVLALAARVAGRRGLVSLAGLRFVGLPVVWAGACMELAVVSGIVPGTTARLLAYGAIGCVTVFLAINHRHPGLKLAAAGVLLNLVVVMANGAMPVDEVSARSVGVETGSADFDAGHEEAHEDTRLTILADRIPVPLADQVLSVGDILLLAGLFLFIARASGSPDRRSDGERSIAAPAGAK
jgi:hypothetical protein